MNMNMNEKEIKESADRIREIGMCETLFEGPVVYGWYVVGIERLIEPYNIEKYIKLGVIREIETD